MALYTIRLNLKRKIKFHECFLSQLAFKVEKEDRLLINSKRKEFNFYQHDFNSSIKDKHLISKGWTHRKSIGDYFIIHPKNEQNINNLETNTTFEKLGLNNDLIRTLNTMGIKNPTPVQIESIPKILMGKNYVIGAETGSGKTLAYLLPIIKRILMWKEQFHERKLNSPLALVLVPSRELAYQIGEIVNKFAQELEFHSQIIIGGYTKKMMTNPEFNKIDLLVATLGAISKLTTTGIYRMTFCHHLVLDEADTLMDDSFNEKLKYFLKHFRLQYGGLSNEYLQGTQLTLVSATLPTNIEESLGHLLPVGSIENITLEKMHFVMEHVPQKFLRLNRSDRATQLLKTVKESVKKNEPVMIFSNKSATCDWISLFLNENGVGCINLNGDMPASLREGTFRQFQDGFFDIISCTDIGSRGLDTKRVKHIINFDFPLYTADYIHRVGRTGRIGSPNNCYVTNFVSSEREIPIVQKIEMAVRSNKKIPNVNGNITQAITNRILKSIRNDISSVKNM